LSRILQNQNKNLSIRVSASVFFVTSLCVSIHRLFQEESVIFEEILFRLGYIEITKNLYLKLNGFGDKF
jgi:hypothetical protein